MRPRHFPPYLRAVGGVALLWLAAAVLTVLIVVGIGAGVVR